MSITLTAFPVAFLLAPAIAAATQSLEEYHSNAKMPEIESDENIESVKVLSNISRTEFYSVIKQTSCIEIEKDFYMLSNGLKVHFDWSNPQYSAMIFTGTSSPSKLLEAAEDFCKDADYILEKNVRIINGKEYFYYNYKTKYTDIQELYKTLSAQGVQDIYQSDKNEISATVDGKQIKYYKPDVSPYYMLQVPQELSIVNIGFGDFGLANSYNDSFSELRIQTNIKQDELRPLLRQTGYRVYEANMQTPLMNSAAVLNWELNNGCWCAVFSGATMKTINNEAKLLLKKLGNAAQRDVRLLNDTSTAIYTYKTNYTDKNTLLNTLYEHGAENIEENGENIHCEIFGMDMNYLKTETGGYVLEITRVSDKASCQELMDELNNEYSLNIQEITYNKIKERLEQENMTLESESVMEDNSIVLTIEI